MGAPSWDAGDIVLGTVDPGIPWIGLPQVKLKPDQQMYHATVWGKSGLGKSKLLQSIFLQHLRQGKTIGLIDPHHDLSFDIIITLLAKGFFDRPDAYQKLVYIDWGNGHFVPFNILAGTKEPHSVALDALDGMLRVWPELETAPLFQQLFLSSAMTLIESRLPIVFLNQILTDESFRRSCLARVTDPLIHQTFAMFDKLGRDQAQAAGSTLRRAFALSFSPLARNTLGHPENWLPFRQWMDQGVSFILNLGNIADHHTPLLTGAELMVQIEQAALSRTELLPAQRRPLTLLIDEWASFAAQDKTISHILSQARKFNLRLYLAAQSLSQISSERLTGALENCKLTINFGLGRESATTQSRDFRVDPMRVKEQALTDTQHNQFYPVAEQFEAWTQELQNLPVATCYVKLHDHEPIRTKVLAVNTPSVDPERLEDVLATYRGLYQCTESEAKAAIEALSPSPDGSRQMTGTAQQPQAYTRLFQQDSNDD
jgi:hypothetical protein